MNQYSIFDFESSLFEERQIIRGKNSKEALEKYLNNKGKKYKLKRGGENPHYQLIRFETSGSVKYKKGRAIWYTNLSIKS